MATKMLKTDHYKAPLGKIGDFERKRMEIALASKSTLIPQNLGVGEIIAFITKTHQNAKAACKCS